MVDINLDSLKRGAFPEEGLVVNSLCTACGKTETLTLTDFGPADAPLRNVTRCWDCTGSGRLSRGNERA